jgi:hypothetical protein
LSKVQGTRARFESVPRRDCHHFAVTCLGVSGEPTCGYAAGICHWNSSGLATTFPFVDRLLRALQTTQSQGMEGETSENTENIL